MSMSTRMFESHAALAAFINEHIVPMQVPFAVAREQIGTPAGPRGGHRWTASWIIDDAPAPEAQH